MLTETPETGVVSEFLTLEIPTKRFRNSTTALRV